MFTYLKLNAFLVNLTLILVLKLTTVHCLPRIFRTNEICGPYNGHRVYLELGDRGDLEAKNVTVPNLSSLEPNDTDTSNNSTLMFFCSLEMVTCPSCRVKITLKFSNFPQVCTNALSSSTPCDCNYLQVSEPRYDADVYGKRFCGQDFVYESKTRSLNLKLIYSKNNSHAFTLEYVSERNRELLSSNPGILDTNGSHNKVITSPFFPSYYPRDYGIEHVLSCKVEACRVHVLFSDFQISTASTMEFYDWNGQRLDVVSGLSFRPPVIISTGPSMLIRFYANGGTDLGYKAKVSFLTPESAVSRAAKPFTNCGGNVDSLGGAITMMHMVDTNETDVGHFNCIWIVKPPNTYLNLRTHLSLRLAKLKKLAGWTEIIIREGTNSISPILEEVQWPRDTTDGTPGFSVGWSTGFYVSLKGIFNSESEMAIVYTAFSYSNCYQGSEFACQNKRCIPIQLQCDGFDHCADNSDENPDICQRQWSKPDMVDRRLWYAQNPNYYFPKMYEHPDIRMATTLFLVCSTVFLLSSFFMVLYKTGVKSRLDRERELQNQLQTISELLDNNNRHVEPDEPPTYEAPPNYEDIIKIGMENELEQTQKETNGDEVVDKKRNRSKSPRPRGQGHKPRSKSRRPSAVSETNTVLEVILPPEEDTLPEQPDQIPTVEQATMQFLLASRLLEISEAQDADASESAQYDRAPAPPKPCHSFSSESAFLTVPENGSYPSTSDLPLSSFKIGQKVRSNQPINRLASFDQVNIPRFNDDSRECSLEPEDLTSDSNQLLKSTTTEGSLATLLVDKAQNFKFLLCPRCRHLLKPKSSGCNRCTAERNLQRFCLRCEALVVANGTDEWIEQHPIPSTSKDTPIQRICVCYSNFPKFNVVPVMQSVADLSDRRSRYGQRKSSSVAEIDVAQVADRYARSDSRNRSFHGASPVRRADNESILLESLRSQRFI